MGNMDKPVAYAKWLNWLDSRFPGSKSRIIKSANLWTGNRLGQDNEVEDPWYEQVITAAATIIPTYYNYKMQSKLVDAQIARARSGQAPLDATYFSTPTALAPTIRHEIDTGISEGTQTLLVFGGLGLAAFYLFSNA